MTKAILLYIKPKWVAKILNGEKTIEIRKKFPEDYRGWVYIYCTKDKNDILVQLVYSDFSTFAGYDIVSSKIKGIKPIYNGEVVARFWCDNVEHFEYDTCSRDICGYWLDNGQIFKNKGTCLSADELWNYIKGKDGYAIHISKLEIFDEPKELSEFKTDKPTKDKNIWIYSSLTKAPQNFCYVESEE